MAGMPYVGKGSDQPKQGKSEVGRDGCRENLENDIWTGALNEVRTAEGLPAWNASRGTTTSERSIGKGAASFTSSAPAPLVAQTPNENVTAELRALSQKFTYVAETEQVASQRREIKQAKEASQPASKVVMPTKPLLQRQRSLTPLQRLGVGALNRSRSCSGLLNCTLDKAEHTKDSALSGDHVTQKGRFPLLPIAHSIGPDASMMKGSEDAVIPDSEDSADDTVSVSEAQEQSKPQIDLGRFAFNG